MSYQDDLDWIARNVHKWPQNTPHVIPDGDSVFERGATFCEKHVCIYNRDFTNSKIIYKLKWLARRTELQNKPSWADAPEWAEWLAQDEDGEWKWLAGLPGKYVDGWTAVKIKGCCKGLTLGDWRVTLEQRPEIDMSAERVQETDKSMGKWHERGELPPVGTECVIWSEGRFPPAECKIVAYSMEQVCVRWNGSGDLDVIDLQFKSPSECKFRPIRSERDEAIEAMKAHCPYPGSWEATYRLFAESLYDAGYRAGCSE